MRSSGQSLASGARDLSLCFLIANCFFLVEVHAWISRCFSIEERALLILHDFPKSSLWMEDPLQYYFHLPLNLQQELKLALWAGGLQLSPWPERLVMQTLNDAPSKRRKNVFWIYFFFLNHMFCTAGRDGCWKQVNIDLGKDLIMTCYIWGSYHVREVKSVWKDRLPEAPLLCHWLPQAFGKYHKAKSFTNLSLYPFKTFELVISARLS